LKTDWEAGRADRERQRAVDAEAEKERQAKAKRDGNQRIAEQQEKLNAKLEQEKRRQEQEKVTRQWEEEELYRLRARNTFPGQGGRSFGRGW
jgi:hypothetical protein